MSVLLDTGPLVALLNRRDYYHRWSLEQAARLSRPLFSCEAVLTEAHFILSRSGNTERLLDLLGKNEVNCVFSYAAHHERVDALMRQYHDVPMSFADACLVCMAEQTDSTVFTLDDDFRVYRLHGKASIDTIAP